MRPLLPLLALALLVAPVALALHGGPTLCHRSTPGPLASGSGLVPAFSSVGHGVHGMQGLQVWVNVQGGPDSHGPFTWHLLDRATGAEWTSGNILEVYWPVFAGTSPYDDLCLEIRNGGSLKEYSFVLEGTRV